MYNLGGILALKDSNFSSAIKKSSKDVNTFNNQIGHTNNRMLQFEKRFAASVVGMAAGYLSVRSLISASKDWVSAANVQIESETKLETMMKNVKGTTDVQINAMKAYASELQGIGVIGDEVGMRGMAQLATFNLQADSIKTLSKGMYDLAVNQNGVNVTGEQMQGIANVVGKAMEGNAGALTRYGVTMTDAQKNQLKFGNEQQRAAVISEVLAANVGGINEAMAKTPEGPMVQINNTLGDMKETLGKKLLPKLQEFAAWFPSKIPQIQATLESGISTGVFLFEKLGSGIDWAKRNAEWLIPVVGGLAASMVTLRVINIVSDLKKKWTKSTIAQTIATRGLNVALRANPLMLWVTGIGLVITAGIYLYRNWDTVKQKATELWDHMVGIWEKIKKFFSDPFGKGGTVKISATSDIGMAGFASGINRVPRDMVARIHKDEAIVPAQYNPYNPGARVGGGNNIEININGYNKSTREIMNELVPELKLALANM